VAASAPGLPSDFSAVSRDIASWALWLFLATLIRTLLSTHRILYPRLLLIGVAAAVLIQVTAWCVTWHYWPWASTRVMPFIIVAGACGVAAGTPLAVLAAIARAARRGAFAKLLRATGSVEGIERVRFTSPHPAAFTDDVIEAMATTEAVMPSLHMPLQSGSDRVLRAMRRSYRTQRFLGILDKVRAVMPEAARSLMTSRTSLIISGSRALVGSSKSMSLGSIASARAMATRCC